MYFQKCITQYRAVIWIFVLSILMPSISSTQEPIKDTRHEQLRDADHFELRMEPVENLEEWKERREQVRNTLLLRAGLWPEPERTPLNAKVFDEKRGNGFTVSKVYFESLPGFLATGNLYRPAKGNPPYPAVVCPHGHWQYGRLQNSESGSIPGRCIDFARMGFVVFSIDMVGYNDSFQLPHDPYKSRAQMKADVPQPYEPRMIRADFDFPEAELYGFNLGSVQLWNGIRAVDFLCSLPDVDPERIGVTGASGGATQTIFLMIADDRIKTAAPVNIIGAEKHPGCRCENMPGLWLDTSTVELSGVFAPKPLLLMSATEDPWTHSTPDREYPMIRKYYSLYGAENMIKNVHIKAGHNYNAETRAAVYGWFCTHLESPFPPVKNPSPISEELKNLGDLRVFPDKILPEGVLTGFKIIENWKAASEKELAQQFPRSPQQYGGFVKTFRSKLAGVLAVDIPLPSTPLDNDLFKININPVTMGNIRYTSAYYGHEGKGNRIEIESLLSGAPLSGNILLLAPEYFGGLLESGNERVKPLYQNLLQKKFRIHRIHGYASGRLSIPQKTFNSFSWSDVYNYDNTLNGINDIITALKYIKSSLQGPVTVIGMVECGIPAAFACAVFGSVDRVIIDMNGSDPGYDSELAELMPYGAIKRAGDFRTAALLLMQNKLVLCNAGSTFDKDWYRRQAEALGFENNLEFRSSVTTDTINELF